MPNIERQPILVKGDYRMFPLKWASKAGMKPTKLDDIEVRGEELDTVRRKFARPQIFPWAAISGFWGAQEIYCGSVNNGKSLRES